MTYEEYLRTMELHGYPLCVYHVSPFGDAFACGIYTDAMTTVVCRGTTLLEAMSALWAKVEKLPAIHGRK